MTYSFLDVQATITGPGGIIPLGNGSGAAEEGITVEPSEDTDTMLIGADGKVVHSLHASKAGRVIIRLLKTSPVNGQLQTLYNFQRLSSANHGRNILAITDIARGDVYLCQDAAFARMPNNAYSKEAGIIEWHFNASKIDPILGQLETL